MDKIKVFSPATVSNVACGFDILGFPIDIIGDEMIVKKTKNSLPLCQLKLREPS